MALPQHHPTGKLRAIESLLDDEIFRSTENLQAEDLQLIGAIVQTYNFIELNLRRCISLFAHSGMMSSPRSSKNIGDLVVAVKAQVVKMDPYVEDISHSIAMLDEIELRRPFRNLLAHWAARRIVNQDAMILFSVDNKDAMRAGS